MRIEGSGGESISWRTTGTYEQQDIADIDTGLVSKDEIRRAVKRRGRTRQQCQRVLVKAPPFLVENTRDELLQMCSSKKLLGTRKKHKLVERIAKVAGSDSASEGQVKIV